MSCCSPRPSSRRGHPPEGSAKLVPCSGGSLDPCFSVSSLTVARFSSKSGLYERAKRRMAHPFKKQTRKRGAPSVVKLRVLHPPLIAAAVPRVARKARRSNCIRSVHLVSIRINVERWASHNHPVGFEHPLQSVYLFGGVAFLNRLLARR